MQRDKWNSELLLGCISLKQEAKISSLVCMLSKVMITNGIYAAINLVVVMTAISFVQKAFKNIQISTADGQID